MLCSLCVISDEAYSFFDKFGSQRSLQISLLAAVGKKNKSVLQWKWCPNFCAEIQSFCHLHILSGKRKQLNKCWLLKLKVKVSVKKSLKCLILKHFSSTLKTCELNNEENFEQKASRNSGRWDKLNILATCPGFWEIVINDLCWEWLKKWNIKQIWS